MTEHKGYTGSWQHQEAFHTNADNTWYRVWTEPNRAGYMAERWTGEHFEYGVTFATKGDAIEWAYRPATTRVASAEEIRAGAAEEGADA